MGGDLLLCMYFQDFFFVVQHSIQNHLCWSDYRHASFPSPNMPLHCGVADGT